MKQKTTKPAKPAKKPAFAQVSRPSLQKGLRLSADHRDQPFEYWPRPSELELAHLAARLARTGATDPGQLVKEAWGIYRECCRRIQEDHREVTRMLEEERSGEPGIEDLETLPTPREYPVEFGEMERLLLPRLKGRTADRAKVVREFVFAEMVEGSLGIVNGQLRPVSYWDFESDDLEHLRGKHQDSVVERFGNYRKREYDQRGYVQFATRFLRWHKRWSALRNTAAKAAAARNGWKKRSEKGEAKTGAKPKVGALKEILEQPPSGA